MATKDKTQNNFQVDADDAVALDQLAKKDGYDNRSAWIRKMLREVLNGRQGEIARVNVLPHPQDATVVPVVEIKGA